jgi:hypothetical protein
LCNSEDSLITPGYRGIQEGQVMRRLQPRSKEAVVKKILSEEQYFLTSVGGIFAVIFVLLVIAIVRLKFYL